MSMSNATVTIPYENLRAMEEQIKLLQEQRAEAEQKLQDAQLDVGDGSIRRYRDAFFVAFAIVQYAIGHLEPMSFRGWPYPRLFQLSTLLKELPYLPTEMSEVATDIAMFAKECKKWEDARAKGSEQQLLAEDNARHNGVSYEPAPSGE